MTSTVSGTPSPAEREQPGPSAAGDARSWPELLIAAVIVVVLAAALVPLAGYRAEARILPMVVGIPALLLALGNLARLAILPRQQRSDDRPAQATPTAEAATSLVAAIGWVLAAGVLVLTLGLLVGSLVFIPLFMRLYGRQQVWVIALVTTGLLGLLYVGFIRGLNIGYYPGLFG